MPAEPPMNGARPAGRPPGESHRGLTHYSHWNCPPSRVPESVGVPAQRIGEILAGRRGITADTDLRLCRFVGLSDGGWLRLQADPARTWLAERFDVHPNPVTQWSAETTRRRRARRTADRIHRPALTE